MSCGKDKGCKYNRKMLNKPAVDNNYCTTRTINEPRDSYNEDWYAYRTMQDTFVHDSVRRSVNPAKGFDGSCLGCNSDMPTCPTQSGIAYDSAVSIDSKLRGL
jgi:hypothetical protein